MLTLGYVTEVLGDQPIGGEVAITDVVIDSRQAAPGALFVALPGEQTDGHNYVADAFERGAVAALVSRDMAPDLRVLDLREPPGRETGSLDLPICLRVGDCLAALQTLAGAWRRRFDVRVIGITGSVGKTSTKELTAEVLSRRYVTLKSEGSYNNEIGVPLTLLRLNEDHECLVVEMGMYDAGEIAELCDMALPHVGVVTIIAPVHAERAGTIERIVQAKTELVEALPPAPEGVAILNRDDERVITMREHTQARVFTYGLNSSSDLWADGVEGLGLDGVRFWLHRGKERFQVKVPLLGRHSVHTALRAAAVGLAEGLTWDEILTGLQHSTAQLRLVAVRGPGGSVVLDDTYNASPDSVIAALNLLAELEGRRVAVLGDMLELGTYAESGHKRVGRRAAAVADLLVTVGELGRIIAREARLGGMTEKAVVALDDSQAAIGFLLEHVKLGDVVLVKGSRALRMDCIVAALSEAAAT
jgi:UDP-N-acetylmuramoyl-tripeptide--D-alanyl-D-alanine ligase